MLATTGTALMEKGPTTVVNPFFHSTLSKQEVWTAGNVNNIPFSNSHYAPIIDEKMNLSLI